MVSNLKQKKNKKASVKCKRKLYENGVSFEKIIRVKRCLFVRKTHDECIFVSIF